VAETWVVSNVDVEVFAWLTALSQVTGHRGKTRFWMSLLIDAIRAHDVLVRAEFEEPSLRS
jgi:hypothetical protein